MKQYRKNIIALTVALVLGPITAVASTDPIPPPERMADRIIPTARPVVANSGEVEYRITLDPLYAATLEIPAKLKGFIRHALTKEDFYPGNEEIEDPTIRYLAYTLADIIHKKPKNITSWAGTEFRLMARPKEIQSLLWQKGIVSIAEIDQSEYEETLTISQSQPTMAPGDTISDYEVVPWWKKYTNTENVPYIHNVVRMIDGPIPDPVLYAREINLTDNGDYGGRVYNNWDIAEWKDKSTEWPFWHSLHVAGVIGAYANNGLGIRGINPGQPIYLYGGGLNYASIADRLNFITASTESSRTWDVISMSINEGAYNFPNQFNFGEDIGRRMAIASNTNLVVQSAGNNDDDACSYSFSYDDEPANPFDGIIVAGGHDSAGKRSMNNAEKYYFNNTTPPGILPIDGSNYGKCVDLWAPSKQITSLRYGYAMFSSSTIPSTQVLSGTSFAAPIAAAIASRYGNGLTRPIERESFLRAYAQNTGYSDPKNFQIKSVKWNAGTTGVLKLYSISSAWSPQNTVNIARLYDQTYQNSWAAEGYEGTVVLDLGQTRTVSVIRVTLRSSVVDKNSPGANTSSVDFTVAATNSITNATISGSYHNKTMLKHFDRIPFSIALPTPVTSRYLILKGINHGSWLAYSEIEAYGY